jgi:hypothetical protein
LVGLEQTKQAGSFRQFRNNARQSRDSQR